MKEYNKLVLYNGTYDNFTPQLDLIYNFDKFEISGKCGDICFYFKNPEECKFETIELIHKI